MTYSETIGLYPLGQLAEEADQMMKQCECKEKIWGICIFCGTDSGKENREKIQKEINHTIKNISKIAKKIIKDN